MPSSYPSLHPAVVTTARRVPLSILKVPTEPPGPGEIVVNVQWTASSPADLHQADGNLVSNYPFILGCSIAGTVVALGPKDPSAVQPSSPPLEVGDQVSGFASALQKQAGFQTYVTVPRHLVGRVPENLSLQEAVTVPVNLVTAFHAITQCLGFDLPWPVPAENSPAAADKTILVWGAAGSVGNYAIQVLHHWGYRNVLAVASKKHHDQLIQLGAVKTFDYNERDVVEQIVGSAGHISYVLDCIGHVEGTLRPLTKIAQEGTRIAVVVPIVIQHASTETEPELTVDTTSVLIREWKEGVQLVPIMAFFYEDNEFFKWHLQPDIIPELLRTGYVKPNKHRIVEGDTLLARAQRALDLLRARAPSGERLVWKVSDSREAGN